MRVMAKHERELGMSSAVLSRFVMLSSAFALTRLTPDAEFNTLIRGGRLGRERENDRGIKRGGELERGNVE